MSSREFTQYAKFTLQAHISHLTGHKLSKKLDRHGKHARVSGRLHISKKIEKVIYQTIKIFYQL